MESSGEVLRSAASSLFPPFRLSASSSPSFSAKITASSPASLCFFFPREELLLCVFVVVLVVAFVVVVLLVVGGSAVGGVCGFGGRDAALVDAEDLYGLAAAGAGAYDGEFDVLADVDGVGVGGVEDVEAVDEEVVAAVGGFQRGVVRRDEAPAVGGVEAGDGARDAELVEEGLVAGCELADGRAAVVLVFVGDDVLDEADDFQSLRPAGLGLDAVVEFDGVPGAEGLRGPEDVAGVHEEVRRPVGGGDEAVRLAFAVEPLDAAQRAVLRGGLCLDGRRRALLSRGSAVGHGGRQPRRRPVRQVRRRRLRRGRRRAVRVRRVGGSSSVLRRRPWGTPPGVLGSNRRRRRVVGLLLLLGRRLLLLHGRGEGPPLVRRRFSLLRLLLLLLRLLLGRVLLLLRVPPCELLVVPPCLLLVVGLLLLGLLLLLLLWLLVRDRGLPGRAAAAEDARSAGPQLLLLLAGPGGLVVGRRLGGRARRRRRRGQDDDLGGLGPTSRARSAAELDGVAVARRLGSRLDVVPVDEDVAVPRLRLDAEARVRLDRAVVLPRVEPQTSPRQPRRVHDDRLLTLDTRRRARPAERLAVAPT